MNDHLLVHPFMGEFGWELMRWQAHVRHVSSYHKKTIVFCKKGYEYLYRDITDAIYPLTLTNEGLADCWSRDKYSILKDDNFHSFNSYASLSPYDQLIPNREICIGEIAQEFIRFGDPKYFNDGVDIVIHARSDKRKVIGDRNWPQEKWVELIGRLKSYKIATIGTVNEALGFKDVLDYRGKDLKQVAKVLSNSKICIGPSSGPMHFASLCGCKHIVWTDARKWNLGSTRGTNRQRYEEVWNPFSIPCVVIDQYVWNPPIEIVYDAIMKEIG